MKIFSSKQFYEADAVTTQKQGITSVELMERAAGQIFNWLHQRMQGAQVPIHIFCGIGNNGGDGLALGRLLINNGYNVTLYIANFTDKRSKCFLVNYDKVKQMTKRWPILMRSEEDFPAIHQDDIIVDCLFGIGLNRAPEGWVKSLIIYLNQQKAFRLSVDIPSGLSSESPLLDPEAIIKANHTLTFQAPKLTFFLPDTGKYVPYFEVLDIGLDAEYLFNTKPLAKLTYKNQARQFYKQREKYVHKGAFGHSLIVGGSYGKIGAAILATTATLKTGAGMVTAFIPQCGYTAMQSALPEAMVLTDEDEKQITSINVDFSPSSIAVGMGMGTSAEAQTGLLAFFKEVTCPIVIDADALNCIAINKELQKVIPESAILTPHEGELKCLIGEWKNDFDKIEKTKKYAQKHNIILVIKGAHTLIIKDNNLYINTTGNPGIATAGSGDTLSGIIAGLLAQGYEPLAASVFGVYLHGSAGNICASQEGFEATIASGIIDALGYAFLELFQEPEPSKQDEGE